MIKFLSKNFQIFKTSSSRFRFFRHVVLSSLISYCLVWIVFPELFIKKNISFMRFSDTIHNYVGIFTFLSNFYHGGIQLWNNYDQMPLTFYYLVGGLSSLSNLLTALIY